MTGVQALGRMTLAMTLTVGCAAGCSVRTVGGTGGGHALTAVFDDVQSLVVGHSVQISDVRAGTVTAIALDGYRARVTMALRVRVPAGTSAAVAKTSLLGENYVRLDPPPGHPLDSGPYLADGAVVTRTSVAPDMEGITQHVGPLLAALSGQDVSTIVDTSVSAFGGQGARLNRLVARISEVSESYAAASADLGRALDALADLGGTLRKGSAELGALPANVRLATERLKNDRAELKAGVQDMLKMSRSFNAKIEHRHGARLRVLLERADKMLAAAVRGRDQLKRLALVVLDFLRAPSVSVNGQGLLMVWLKGFLPPGDAGPARAQGLDLTELAGPPR
ncbi:MlaD family protein [Actinocorallia sp. API 0066]|uniref:MlaD family protein n=1 Tax=Actinocorallia sp. API 0066 TaxID=2896846 RepID=UPI001E4A98C9|nr:MlaD family protein [Actinocorallia sp. API 0066]MCD0449364.1 MlaD family protein [Actinocorallia sp. API 0066]